MLLVIGVLIGELLYNIHVDLDFYRTTIKQLREEACYRIKSSPSRHFFFTYYP